MAKETMDDTVMAPVTQRETPATDTTAWMAGLIPAAADLVDLVALPEKTNFTVVVSLKIGRWMVVNTAAEAAALVQAGAAEAAAWAAFVLFGAKAELSRTHFAQKIQTGMI